MKISETIQRLLRDLSSPIQRCRAIFYKFTPLWNPGTDTSTQAWRIRRHGAGGRGRSIPVARGVDRCRCRVRRGAATCWTIANITAKESQVGRLVRGINRTCQTKLVITGPSRVR